MRTLLFHFFANLPCSACIWHASLYYRTHPPTLDSRTHFIEWIVAMHNEINRRLGKKSDWTPEEAFHHFYLRHFTSIRVLPESQRKRLEDHNLLKASYALLDRYRDLALNKPVAQSAAAETPTDEPASPAGGCSGCTAAWVVCGVLGALLLLACFGLLVQRRTSQRKWRSEQQASQAASHTTPSSTAS